MAASKEAFDMTTDKPDSFDPEATLPTGQPLPAPTAGDGPEPRRAMPRVHSFGRTDMGLRRKNNEDAFHVDGSLGLCILADGMGGAAAGELASQIFAQTAVEVFSRQVSATEDENLALLKQAYQTANERIISHVRGNPGHAGMGCTAEILRFFNERFTIGHVGDSRAYLFRKSELKQLTRDHSLVQDQVDQGLITREEARRHRLRNVILRAVGTKEDLDVDFVRGRVLPGDLFLLCSDGLTDMVEDQVIWRVLSRSGGISEKVDQLIELANRAGGSDNVTVVLSEVLPVSPEPLAPGTGFP
jgi:protein phosphatase